MSSSAIPHSAPEALAELKNRLQQVRRENLRPPPTLNLVEWADEFRMLSSESSSEPGKWRTSRVEVARGPMLAITDPAIREVTVMACTQLLKTELINNTVGYYIHQDPGPMLLVQPTEAMAQAWSKERLAPMVRDTPVLSDLVKDPRSRDSNNTILHKVFPGGHISMVGSNAPAGLAMRPVRVALFDEIDKYPASAGTEGDPIKLGEKRTTTFFNAKIVKACSPTVKGMSRIEKSYETSDKRKYFIPCPHCGDEISPTWANVRWDKSPEGEHLPETASISCENCGALWSEIERLEAIKKGVWKATAPFKGHAGFQVSALFSPWVTLASLVKEFLECKDDTQLLKTFVNTQLAETFEESNDSLEASGLYERREDWGSAAPREVVLVTVGADVQADRIEAEKVGWGPGEESWSLEYKVFYGDPAQKEVWEAFDGWLLQGYPSERKEVMPVHVTCIDSGGRHTQEVYEFCRSRLERRVFAIKGMAGTGRAIVSRPLKNNRLKIPLFALGVDTAKERLMARLRRTDPGAGMCHFPMERDMEYFEQLTAEKQVTRYHKGVPSYEWRKTRPRNEALDCRVYAMAALIISGANLERMHQKITDTTPPPPKRKDAEEGRGPWLNNTENWLDR